MDPEHRYELVAFMWVGRGDFGEQDWPSRQSGRIRRRPAI